MATIQFPSLAAMKVAACPAQHRERFRELLEPGVQPDRAAAGLALEVAKSEALAKALQDLIAVAEFAGNEPLARAARRFRSRLERA